MERRDRAHEQFCLRLSILRAALLRLTRVAIQREHQHEYEGKLVLHFFVHFSSAKVFHSPFSCWRISEVQVFVCGSNVKWLVSSPSLGSNRNSIPSKSLSILPRPRAE